MPRLGRATMLILVIAATAITAGAASAAALPGVPLFPGGPSAKNGPKPRPRTITFTGDDTGFFGDASSGGAQFDHPGTKPKSDHDDFTMTLVYLGPKDDGYSWKYPQ